MPPKTVCPINRQQFKDNARALEVKIGDQILTADPREFSTGSLGWYVNRKCPVKVGETTVTVQIGLNITIVGSKELPKDQAPPSAEVAGGAAEAVTG